jgi:hypothetical protein
MTSFEFVAGYKLQLQCQTFDLLVFLSSFCLYLSSLNFLFLTFSILQLLSIHCMFPLIMFPCRFLILFVFFFKYSLVFCHTCLSLLEVIFLILISEFLLSTLFLTIHPSNFLFFHITECVSILCPSESILV